MNEQQVKELLALIRQMPADIAELKAQSFVTAKSTALTSKILDRASSNGDAISVASTTP